MATSDLVKTVTWERGQTATHVIIAGNVFRWKDKAPYVSSGFSVLGALEYNHQKDEVKCHDCGAWCRDIATHIHLAARKSSGIHKTARDYRIKHGFRMASALTGLLQRDINKDRQSRSLETKPQRRSPTRERRQYADNTETDEIRKETYETKKFYSIPPRAESDNLVSKCKAQRLSDLKQFAEKSGRTPTKQEFSEYLNAHGKRSLIPNSLESLFGMSFNKILSLAGLGTEVLQVNA